MRSISGLRFLAILGLALSLSGTASAHRLLVVNEAPLSPETALVVEDVDVSQVAYHVASAEAPELWLTFQASAGQKIYLETGVPFIDRLTGSRPVTVLVGPGLPQVEVPFPLPAGSGAIIYETAAETDPEVFDEPFTGTQSWKFGPWEPVLPETGTYYVVTYLPDGADGKFWTAVGRAEVFGLEDLFTLPQIVTGVRSFHEVFPWGGLLGWGFTALIAAIGGLLKWLFAA